MSIAITINEKEFEAAPGQTVMELAQQQDIHIPHFCWHPGLSIAGVCRFCMVEVEGRPKLEIACNLPVTEGMKVRTDSEQVKEAHKWALEFHLINHPLDCPICDQAGECGLQDYYMQVGKYQAQMTQDKVLKPKKLNVGTDLVLDTERCILCSRCVRFEDEVTKTGALGIFDRGDRSIIGTYQDKLIEHDYTTNLVDICPVGAFTSKDFRFKKRVWFTQDAQTICPGCSTGCAIDLAFNADLKRYYRIKPRFSEVNGHWMCNFGRGMYEHLNVEQRLISAYTAAEEAGEPMVKTDTAQVVQALAMQLQQAQKIALLVTPQYTVEDYRALFAFFVGKLGVRNVHQWRSRQEDVTKFDGILWRGDQNPNSRGLLEVLAEFGIKKEQGNEFDTLAAGNYDTVLAFVPQVLATFADIETDLQKLQELPYVSLWASAKQMLDYRYQQVIALPCFAEQEGTYRNYAGTERQLQLATSPVSAEVLSITMLVEALAGHYDALEG